MRAQMQTDNAKSRLFTVATLSASSLFILGMATNTTTLWGVRSNLQELAGMSAIVETLAGQSRDLARAHEHGPADNENIVLAAPALTAAISRDTDNEAATPPPEAKAAVKVREARNRPVYGQWGPPLLLNPPRPARTTRRASGPPASDLQEDLCTLGFDTGEHGADRMQDAQMLQALNEFRLLYFPARERPKKLAGNELADSVRKYAALATKDHRKFGIDSGILAAIRLGSMRTGIDFSFLMELAAAESSFDPTRIAHSTGAAGLYQFKDGTWLESVKKYGKKYGIGRYASQVENYVDDAGKARPSIDDPVTYRHVLNLRHNPRIAALLAGEYVKNNMKRLSSSLDHKPGYTELYLTHFFGTSGAISFLKVLDEDPDRIAGEVFPDAAKTNRSIFRTARSRPRTVTEIYKMFERKFDTARYRDANPG
jgi:hypothetical protein